MTNALHCYAVRPWADSVVPGYSVQAGPPIARTPPSIGGYAVGPAISVVRSFAVQPLRVHSRLPQ